MPSFQNDTIQSACKTQSFILDCLLTAKASSDDPAIHDAGVTAQREVVALLERAVTV